MSSNGVEPQEECPICIRVFDVEFSRPESCQHRFHRPCIREWSKFKTDCPMCRVAYKRVFVYEQNGETRKLITTDTYEAPENNPLESDELLIGINNAYDLTHCRICGGGDHEESILLCDDCDEGFHLWCLSPQLTEVPQDEWFCDDCRASHQRVEPPRLGHRGARIVRRTLREERLVNSIRRRIVSSDEESEAESDEHNENDDVPDFEEMDRMVLDGVIEDSGANLPSISRKRKSKKKQRSLKKKRGVNPSSIRKRRRSTRKTTRRRSRKNEEGESSSKRSEIGRERAEIPSLSLTGAGMPHFAEDDEGRQPESPPPMPQETDCDILGMIIEEQEKVLTPGNLLKIEGGKFEKSDGFKEYQKDIHARMSDNLKVSLGMQESGRTDFGRAVPRDGHRDASPDTYRMDEEVQEQLFLVQQEKDDQLRELQMKALAQKRKEEFERALLDRRRDEQERREKERHEREQEKQQKLKEERRRKRERYEEKEREKEERDRIRKREKSTRDDEKKRSDRHREEGDRHHKEDDRSRKHKSSSNGRDRSRDNRERPDKDRKSEVKTDRRPTPPPIPPPPMNPIIAPFGVQLNPLMGNVIPSDVMNALLVQQLFGQQGTIFPSASTSSVLPIPLPAGLPPSTAGTIQAPPVSVSKPTTSKTLKKEDIVKRVEEIAKKYAKKYFESKKIAADEYKIVMRTVVKECARKEILDKRLIYERVKLAVNEVKRRK